MAKFPERGAIAVHKSSKIEFIIHNRVINQGVKYLKNEAGERFRLDACKEKTEPKPKLSKFDSLTVDGFTYYSEIDTVVHLIDIRGNRARIRAPGDRERNVEVSKLKHPHNRSLTGRFVRDSI